MTNPKNTQVGGNHYAQMKIQPMEFSMVNGLNPMQHDRDWETGLNF